MINPYLLLAMLVTAFWVGMALRFYRVYSPTGGAPHGYTPRHMQILCALWPFVMLMAGGLILFQRWWGMNSPGQRYLRNKKKEAHRRGK